MRRKLIQQDAFDAITKQSVTSAARELLEAQNVLAHTLGKDFLNLHSFTESTVLYETLDKSYVHAGYQIENNNVVFNNIEELVIDEASRKEKVRGILSEMIDAVLVDNHAKAKGLFNQYMEKIDWKKAEMKNKEEGDDEKESPFPSKKMPFGEKSARKHSKEQDEDTDSQKANRKKFEKNFEKKASAAGKEVKEAFEVSRNVLDYVDYMKMGPALKEAVTKTDDKGNVTHVKFPNTQLRNESKILEFDWNTLNHKVKYLRNGAAKLSENAEFCKAVSYLRRQNALSDNQALEECLDDIVKNHSSVLYVTQSELTKIVSEALEMAGEHNYDDQTCEFMAEGIMRHAHEVYSEKVEQILRLARAPKMEAEADAYEFFQFVVEQFYPSIDEKFGLERKVFSDLYESMEKIYRGVNSNGNNLVKSEAANYLNELADVLNGELPPTIDLAEEVAYWMQRLIESNVEGSSETWNVSNKPHVTVSGDHPQMSKNAKVPAVSGRYTDDWGDEAPMISQDNMSYKSGAAKTARSSSWGNEGGSEVFPSLKNPYVPKPFGDYTMKNEKGADKDALGQHWSTWQSGDTWPKLQNPYVPTEAGGEGGKGYKMKDGSETDLVVDR